MSRPSGSSESPPVLFADAERLNASQPLLDLHEHSLTHGLAPNRTDSLVELALAVVARWTSWQPAMIHNAFRAAATGLDPAEIVRRWQRWTHVQTTLVVGGRPAINPVEVRAISTRLGLEVTS